MFLKAVVVLVLLAVVLALSGCCCCPFLTGGNAGDPQTSSGSTDPGDASMLIGDEWSSSSSLTYEDNYGSYAGDDGVSVSVQFFENGTFVTMGVSYGSSQMGYYIKGHYHVSGNTIKFTDVVESDYHVIAQGPYQTKNIGDKTGTFTVDTTSDEDYDTLKIDVQDMWGGDTQSFSRYKPGKSFDADSYINY